MNISRAIGFSFILYIVSLGLFAIIQFVSGMSFQEVPTFGMFVFGWICNIPIILLLAKWYFRKSSQSWKIGFTLGIIAILSSMILDGVCMLFAHALGESPTLLRDMYTDWKLYLTALEILLLTTYAGYEFDKTYTAPDSSDVA